MHPTSEMVRDNSGGKKEPYIYNNNKWNKICIPLWKTQTPQVSSQYIHRPPSTPPTRNPPWSDKMGIQLQCCPHIFLHHHTSVPSTFWAPTRATPYQGYYPLNSLATPSFTPVWMRTIRIGRIPLYIISPILFKFIYFFFPRSPFMGAPGLGPNRVYSHR